MTNTVAVIPAYNEEDTVASVVNQVYATGIVDTVIVVDDCSTDETAARVEDTDALLLSTEDNRHVGGATKLGCTHAIELGADIIVRLDGDGQHDPDELFRFHRKLLASDCQYVIGNRFADSSFRESMPYDRQFGNRIVSLVTSLRVGQYIPDPTCGYRAMNAKYLRRIPLHRLSNDFQFLIEELLSFNYLDAGIEQTSISCIYDSEESSLTYSDGASFLLPNLLWWNRFQNALSNDLRG